MHRALLIIYLMALSIGTRTQAQDQKTEHAEPAETGFSYLMTDVSAVTDAVFMGRRDTVAAPYLLPSIGYYHKSGLFAAASFSYLLASGEGRVDLFLFTGGIRFGKQDFNGSVSATAYLFNEESYNVQAETTADLSAALSYDWGPLETTLQASSYFGNGGSADFFAGIGLKGNLYTAGQQLLWQPGIAVYGGSQSFYEAYYNTSRLGNRKGGGMGSGSAGPAQELIVEEARNFELLNAEASLPLYVFHKQWIFSAEPILAVPFNPATVTGPDFSYTEDLQPVFYFRLGISYWVR